MRAHTLGVPEFYESYGDCICHDNVNAIRETESGLLVVINSAEHWIPKSQIHDDSEVYKADTDGTLVITRWFAEQRGWA